MLKSFLKRKKQKGFTLIELIAVMTILGLLALLIIPRFTNVSDSAKVKIFENNARTLASQVSLYTANNDGKFPSTGTRTKTAAPAEKTDMLVLEEGLPTDYFSRVDDSETETYALQAATSGNKGALICTMKLNGRNYVYVYDFGTSETSKGGADASEVSITGGSKWKAGTGTEWGGK